MRFLSYIMEASKKAIAQAEKEAREWSKDPDNQDQVAWVVIYKGKPIVTANASKFPTNKIISKWSEGNKVVNGIKLRHIGQGKL